MDGKLWRENRKENFFGMCLVEWGGRKISNGIQVFSPLTHPKVFFPKWRENSRKKLDIIFGQKCPCAIAHGLIHIVLHFFYSFSFLLDVAFFFFFALLGRLPTCLVLMCVCMFLLLLLFRCDFFFLDMIFF